MNMSVDRSNQPTEGSLVASIPKDQLRSLFYLFTGKPDSRIKVFNDPIFIEPIDIIELNNDVIDKLATHHIDLNVTSVKIGYVGSKFSEFSTWIEFENHKWQGSETIEELVIKWDFLVNIKDYKAPQRHTLLFRVARDFKPSQIFHMLGAGNVDELDKIDEISAPAFCRVDFINAQISKELTNLVEDWYQGRKQPKLINPTLYWFKKKRHGVATVFDQWLVLSWVLLAASLIYWGSENLINTPITIIQGVIITIITLYSFRPIGKMSHIVASHIYTILSNIEGNKVVFSFTSGDKKRIYDLEDDNRKQGRKFIKTSLWNIILNITAAIIYTLLFINTNK